MVNLKDAIQTQKDTISKGGWKKWGAYLALAALAIIGVAVVLLKDYLLLGKLAKAKTEAAVAKEELIQDEVDDKISNIAALDELLEKDIVKLNEELRKITELAEISKGDHGQNVKAIERLKDWEDVELGVVWNEDD